MSPHKLIRRLVEDAGGALPVAKAMGTPGFQPTLHKICSGRVRSPSHETARRIADHFGLNVLALYDETIAASEWERLYGADPTDHDLRPFALPQRMRSPAQVEAWDPELLPEEFTKPALLNRETLMTNPGRGPSTFKTVLEDEALAPERPTGTLMVWDRNLRPTPGRPVLVLDAHGRLHARIYREGKTPGGWHGVPSNPAYAEYGSADGATVYASASWSLIAES